MLDPFRIIKNPILSERSIELREKENKYVFLVDLKATKREVKKAVEELFKVKVVKVNTEILPGKGRRQGANFGYRSDRKKAVVGLQAGNKIDVTAETK
ncbi:MAG: 50S ribosomal protein L23 [Elusimicrobiota bacterium]